MSYGGLCARDARRVSALNVKLDKLSHRYYHTRYKSDRALLSEMARIIRTIDYIYKSNQTDNVVML